MTHRVEGVLRWRKTCKIFPPVRTNLSVFPTRSTTFLWPWKSERAFIAVELCKVSCLETGAYSLHSRSLFLRIGGIDPIDVRRGLYISAPYLYKSLQSNEHCGMGMGMINPLWGDHRCLSTWNEPIGAHFPFPLSPFPIRISQSALILYHHRHFHSISIISFLRPNRWVNHLDLLIAIIKGSSLF